MSPRQIPTAVPTATTKSAKRDPVDDLLGRLDGVKQRYGYWVAQCPSHEDQNPSLSIKQGGKGQALVKCHAGCDTERIVAAVGLKMADLFVDKSRSNGTRRSQPIEVDRYSYTDEDGNPLFDVVRYEPKDFRQFPPGRGDGTIKGIRRVLYNLRDIEWAKKSAQPVYLVEGEKDADRLTVAQQVIATTSPMGAGKWADDYADALIGVHRVVVIPDNDSAGGEHAAQIVESLKQRGIGYEIRQSLRGKDVSDHLDAGLSLDDLQLIDENDIEAAAIRQAEIEALRVGNSRVGVSLDLEATLDGTLGFINRFLYFDSEHEVVAMTLFTANSHVFPAFDTTPYLNVKSPEKQSGKTRTLEVLDLLVRAPMMAANISPAALFRVVEKHRPTLLIDETDNIFMKRRSADPNALALLGIINSGYQAKGRTVRMGGKNNTEIQEFSTYSPKVLAGIGELPDTVADRSIPIRLDRKPRSVEVERFRRRDVRAEATALRDALNEATLSRFEEIEASRPMLPDALSDRAQEIWEPLFAIADLASESWGRRARAAAVALHEAAEGEADGLGIELLDDLRSIWPSENGSPQLGMWTSDILKKLKEIEESRWANWYGRDFNARDLAEMLDPYRVKSTDVKQAGTTRKGYRHDGLYVVWERYLSSLRPDKGNFSDFSDFSTGSRENQGQPRGNPEATPPEGSGEVADGLPLENSTSSREVAEVAEVAHTPTGEEVEDCENCGIAIFNGVCACDEDTA